MEMVSKKEAEKKKREIPEEIIVEEIMWRLPVKTLVCFRSVCKTWNSIIASDPKLAILQLKNSSTCFDHSQRAMLWDCLEDSSAFFVENKNQSLASNSNNSSEFAIKKINTSPIKVGYSSRCSIVAGCDGLVCILDKVTNSILFWNPLTGETKRVSDDSPGGNSELFNIYGLSYDSSTDDYKLVWIKLRHDSIVTGLFRPNEVHLFSLRTNSWRQIQDFPIIIFPLEPGVFINGALYWTGFSVGSLSCRSEVAYLCLEKENYRLLDIPLTDVCVPSFRFGIRALLDIPLTFDV